MCAQNRVVIIWTSCLLSKYSFDSTFLYQRSACRKDDIILWNIWVANKLTITTSIRIKWENSQQGWRFIFLRKSIQIPKSLYMKEEHFKPISYLSFFLIQICFAFSYIIALHLTLMITTLFHFSPAASTNA
jgi:hypothetical protein